MIPLQYFHRSFYPFRSDREFETQIEVTNENWYLTEYVDLTMAASYEKLNISGVENISFVQLIDISGKTVLAKKFSATKAGNQLSIETGMLHKGMYILSVSQGSTSHQQKLIIRE